MPTTLQEEAAVGIWVTIDGYLRAIEPLGLVREVIIGEKWEQADRGRAHLINVLREDFNPVGDGPHLNEALIDEVEKLRRSLQDVLWVWPSHINQRFREPIATSLVERGFKLTSFHLQVHKGASNSPAT